MKLLAIEIDNSLNFQLHVSTICKKAARQINTLSRLKSCLNQDERSINANSFIYSNFDYCPLIWNLCSQRWMNEIENIQKRTLRFVLNDTPPVSLITTILNQYH